jgi:hypothetical protein
MDPRLLRPMGIPVLPRCWTVSARPVGAREKARARVLTKGVAQGYPQLPLQGGKKSIVALGLLGKCCEKRYRRPLLCSILALKRHVRTAQGNALGKPHTPMYSIFALQGHVRIAQGSALGNRRDAMCSILAMKGREPFLIAVRVLVLASPPAQPRSGVPTTAMFRRCLPRPETCPTERRPAPGPSPDARSESHVAWPWRGRTA